MKYKVKLDKSQQFSKIEIGTINNYNTNYNIYICGKVDGILHLEDYKQSKLIEVKTRTRCFFKEVRDYENTQMQIYMHMLDMTTVDLVEYLPQNKTKIKITSIVKNEKTIKNIIKKLNCFINKFIEFINYPIEQKYEFYTMDLDDKKIFLKNLYLNELSN